MEAVKRQFRQELLVSLNGVVALDIQKPGGIWEVFGW